MTTPPSAAVVAAPPPSPTSYFVCHAAAAAAGAAAAAVKAEALSYCFLCDNEGPREFNVAHESSHVANEGGDS